jgi:hypothetical protein
MRCYGSRKFSGIDMDRLVLRFDREGGQANSVTKGRKEGENLFEPPRIWGLGALLRANICVGVTVQIRDQGLE